MLAPAVDSGPLCLQRSTEGRSLHLGAGPDGQAVKGTELSHSIEAIRGSYGLLKGPNDTWT